ncbi:MAG TPA: hypothetical protein VMV86_03755 [Methanosarcinales archaeon]|nr:hypothetical protein [Methanosarcinales archaeon]
MEIPLTISEVMDAKEENKLLERRLIRMPRDFRDLFMFKLHDYISIRSVSSNKIVVLQIAPAYKEDAERDPLSAYVTSEAFGASKVKGAEKTAYRNIEVVQGITLGCDPELFLIDEHGNIVPANRFFRRYSNVGYDGSMMELRPLPSTSEKVVADNIMALIRQARNTLDGTSNILAINGVLFPNGKKIKMVAASSYKGTAAGFHIHFGLPAQLLGNHKYARKLLAGQMVKALDFYVGIPAIIPEGSEDYFRRTFVASAYGKPGNFILDHRTLEYRVPGGVLLKHPLLTQGILALGATVIEDVVSRVKILTNNYSLLETMLPDQSLKTVYPNIPVATEIYQTIVAPNIESASNKLGTIINDVRQMVGYEARAKTIELFFKVIQSKFSNDVELNWRGYYEGQPGSMDMYPS